MSAVYDKWHAVCRMSGAQPNAAAGRRPISQMISGAGRNGGSHAYVDGYIVPVPRRKLEAYRRASKKMGKIWREHGALDLRECVADDVKVGKRTSFPRSVKLKPNETVIFSWVVFKTRAHRDRVNAQVMKDPRLAALMDPKAMPFDGKRMIYGGFTTLVEG